MKSMVKAIIAGSCIIVLGVAILIVALALNGGTFKAHFDTKEFNAEYEHKQIVLESSAGSVKINYYDGETVKIVYPEAKNYKVDIEEKDGYMQITGPSPKWYEFSIWWANIPEITINLPKSTTFQLNLTLNAGSLRLDGEYSSVWLNVNAGTLRSTNFVCTTLYAKVNAGSMIINHLRCSNKFEGEVNAGSLNVSYIDCPEITAKVSAGSLNMKVWGLKTDYRIYAYVSAGSSNIESQNNTSDRSINARVSAGSLNVTFLGYYSD